MSKPPRPPRLGWLPAIGVPPPSLLDHLGAIVVVFLVLRHLGRFFQRQRLVVQLGGIFRGLAHFEAFDLLRHLDRPRHIGLLERRGLVDDFFDDLAAN